MINLALLEYEFPQDKELIYLNHAAVSPWPRRSSSALKQFADENCVTGAEYYPQWMNRENILRKQLRSLINAESIDEISLLKNTSEALSVVACGIDWNPGDNIVSTNEEFPSNRIPWEAQKDKGVDFRAVPVQTEDPEAALIAACDNNTRIMTISSVQYGSGLKFNLEKLGQYCRSNDILFCVDAIQSIGSQKFDVRSCYIDFAMADAHKWMMGPEGIAVFYCRADVRDRLRLHQYGWRMLKHAGDYDRQDWEVADNGKRFECGSPNMLGTYVLSASLSLIEEIGIETIEMCIREKSAFIIDKLNMLPNIKLLSNPDKNRLAGIVNFQTRQHKPQELYRQLMQNRVICANRFGGIRFSPHFYTPESKIDRALQILSSLL